MFIQATAIEPSHAKILTGLSHRVGSRRMQLSVAVDQAVVPV